MLEHNELARALTELPDELLLEEAQLTHRKKPVKFRRLIAAAAVIAMLAVTVGAVSAGITWSQSRKTAEEVIQRFGAIYEDYYQTPDGILDFEKLEFNLPLELVELPEQNMARLEGLVRTRWNLSEQTDEVQELDFYLQNYKGHYISAEVPHNSFGSLTDVEDMLGITLDVPDTLRKAIQADPEGHDNMVWVRLYAGATESQSVPEPTKVEIRFQLTGYAGNGQATGTIIVALNEEAAREGMLVESYSYEKEGPFWQEEQTVGGYAVNLYGNDPEEGFDGAAGAVYTSGGIGYHICGSWYRNISSYLWDLPFYDCAKDIVLSLFAGSE
ncbi:MAG: hypothetical protein IJO05_06085 [Oscillospiraceae bacterium]|nr:hypothetical protein [Oscillospiraceae bacterium]